jgi:hypothetical protein
MIDTGDTKAAASSTTTTAVHSRLCTPARRVKMVWLKMYEPGPDT